MATANRPTFDDLNARAKAIGLELICDDARYAGPDEREYYLLDPSKRTVLAGNHGLESIDLELATLERETFWRLKKRVEALGHKLVFADGLHDSRGTEYRGLYILNPRTDELIVVTAGGADDDVHEIAGWCEKREQQERPR